ncbi:MAG: hypothetical protein ACI84D_003613, partial [Thalassolituus oleivorans]
MVRSLHLALLVLIIAPAMSGCMYSREIAHI